MRIAFSGSAGIGKTTVVNDFLKNWPNYKKSNESYRDLLKKEKIPINKKVNKDGQWKILNCLVDDLQNTKKGDKILFDRCPLDNIVYSLWSFEKGNSDIDKEFIDKCVPIVSESMRHLDIIFYIPITKAAKLEYKDTREIDIDFNREIDNIFKAVEYSLHRSGSGACPFFPKDDSPAIIEIFGTPEERIKIIELYVDKDGSLVSDEESVLSSENLEYMETLLGVQKQVKDKEDEEKRLKAKFLKGVKKYK